MSSDAAPSAAGGLPADPTLTIHSSGVSEQTVIGPYLLLRKIGEGGMGVVYHAQQREPIRRDVALKIIKPGMDSRPVIARFESERQALAVMDHPNVARVLDAATTAGGLPYFVMELVNGVPLNQYCDSKSLTVRERIELFIPVCSAIQHAHQKGIIHRDIKPSNILVAEQEGKPVPKVIDFGLAKALSREVSDATVMTNLGTVVGTLDYMSPEQAELSRQDVDTRTDIYSLGAVLYELLTGTTPLERRQMAGLGYLEALRRIRDEETPPPSTRLRASSSAATARQRRSDTVQLSKLLHGDLDWIVMKALEKDRTRRYETANALSRDLQRYLAGEPVEAAPPSAAYRMSRFARKHRAALATAAAFAALLVAGITFSVMEARRAQRRFAQVRELANTFLFQFYDQVSPLPGSTAVRASIAETARKYLDNLAAEAANDRGLLLELAQAYSRLAVVQGGHSTASLGLVDDARRSYQHSIALFNRLGVDASSPAEWRREAARSYLGWCELERAGFHMSAAEPLALKAVELTRESGGDDAGFAQIAAGAGLNLGEVRFYQGRVSEAIPLFEGASRSLQNFQANHHADPGVALELASLQAQAARARVRLGDLDGALSVFDDIVRNLQPCDPSHPTPAQCRPVAIYVSWLADVYGAMDRPSLKQFDRAAELYQKSLTILEAMAEADANDRQVRFDLAGRYGKLADAIWQREPERALRLYDQAMATASKLASRDRMEQLQQAYWNSISRPLIALGRTGEARRALSSARDELSRSHDYDDELTLLDLRLLWGRLLAREGKPEEARRALEEGIQAGEAVRKSHTNDLKPIFLLSNLYRELAGLNVGDQRRDAFLRSAELWHAWPKTSYTEREEQSDRAAAAR